MRMPVLPGSILDYAADLDVHMAGTIDQTADKFTKACSYLIVSSKDISWEKSG